MKLFVRPASLPDERRRLIELLSRNLPHLDHDLRYDWMYTSNPAGPGRVWFVCAGSEEHVFGTVSIFPRSVWIQGRQEVCAQVGDFAVDPSYRSLGPALMLQKATLAPVDAGEFAFCYDCPPHDRGMATFRRLGLSAVCRMERLARLLNVEGTLERYLPGGRMVRAPMAVAINGLLRALGKGHRTPKRVTVARLEGDFGEEFSVLDKEIASSAGAAVMTRRNSEDLNWRFRCDPLSTYTVLTARRPGNLLGFAVYSSSNGRARIADVVARSDEIAVALLRAAAADAGSAGAETIDLLAVSHSVEASLARKARYLHRADAERVVVYGGHSSASLLSRKTTWKLTASDIMA